MRRTRFQQNPAFVNHVHDLVLALLNQIFQEHERQLSLQKETIIADNASLGGSVYGFFYDGDLISVYAPAQLRGHTILPIHESLEDAADTFIQNQKTLRHDRQRIEAGFSVVSSKCRTTQDIRDALPDTLAALVPEIGELPRSRPEGFLFQNSTILKKQFQDTLDLLFDYQFKNQMDALAGVSSQGVTP